MKHISDVEKQYSAITIMESITNSTSLRSIVTFAWKCNPTCISDCQDYTLCATVTMCCPTERGTLPPVATAQQLNEHQEDGKRLLGLRSPGEPSPARSVMVSGE